LRKDLTNIQKNKLFVGSGVEDVYDSNLHTVLDKFGQYTVDYKVGKDKTITKILLNSDNSRNEDDIAKTTFSKTPKIRHNDKIGYYLTLYVGHVVQDNYRKNGSSGGFVSWVASKLLESGKNQWFYPCKEIKNTRSFI
jgi:coenzyme F420 hydrogenase subunit beta